MFEPPPLVSSHTIYNHCFTGINVVFVAFRSLIAKCFKSSPDLAEVEADLYPPNMLTSTAAISEKVKECMMSSDIHDAIDTVVCTKQFPPYELTQFYIDISDQFVSLNDNVTALHFLQTAHDQLPGNDIALNKLLIQKFIAIGRPDIATDIAFQSSLETDKLQLSEQERKTIQTTYEKNRQAIQSKAEHGHDLLLSYLKTHLNEFKFSPDRKPVLIEIGTTRENLPGQGSTRKISEFCRDHHLHFITVDMDPHNTRVAASMFSEMNLPFEAITMKGEEYLKEFTGTFDFIFLDAYDFDHGGHSSLRQIRYIKFLGNPIDEIACHQMHLDCAKSVITKLSPFGVVCFDDTWLVDGKWMAKGTTAMPYLLANRFHLLEARNNAALLTREKTAE